MDWLDFWARRQIFGEFWEERAKRKRAKVVHAYRQEITAAICDLDSVLLDLDVACTLAMDLDAISAVRELLPLYPFAEALSLQGFIGTEQQDILASHINLTQPRYNVAQFTKAAIEREGIYDEWNELVGLSQDHCGTVWRTLLEMICRLRTPDAAQQIIDAIGKIFYNFYLLEHPNISLAQPSYGAFISSLNHHAETIQQEPYLHAVMLLQLKLSEKFGGKPEEYIPQLDSEAPYDMNGIPGFEFSVSKEGDVGFIRFFAVKNRITPDQPDLIWELPASRKDPLVFFAE